MINNIFKESVEYLYGTETDRDFINFYLRHLSKDNYLIKDYQKDDESSSYIYAKNTEIINLQLDILKLTRDFKSFSNNYTPTIERLNNMIEISDGNLRTTYQYRLKLKINEMRDKLKPIVVQIIKKKHELNQICKQFKNLGISFFTDEKVFIGTNNNEDMTYQEPVQIHSPSKI